MSSQTHTRLNSEEARLAVPAGFHGPVCEFPSDWGIHNFFESQARRTPQNTAFLFRESRLTYSELDQRAGQLAQRLGQYCAAPDTVIGICLDRSLEMMAGLLGILKAGAAYLPLDPSFPHDRLEFMLQDAGAKVLVTDHRLRERFHCVPENVVLLEPGSEPAAAAWPAPAKAIEVNGRNLAYVMYTSGSSGRPKGVMVEHRQVANFFTAMDTLLGFGSGVWLAVTSISFDISVLELFWTMARGFTVVLQSEAEMFAPASAHSIAAQITRHGVTHLECTPSLARMLVSNRESFEALGTLGTMLLGGEALPAALAERLRTTFPGEMFNMYGPTETTVWSTAYRVRGGEPIVPIGTPLANTTTLVLDGDGRLVAAGDSGELFIGGAGVGRGYYNRPELTAERFISNPLAEDGERLYRTGDLVRRRSDGNLEFLGRIDNQVKILGHRIEPEEIETTLARHPLVRAAAVIAEDTALGEKKLVAYLVPEDEQMVNTWDLRIYLQEILPPHMVPAEFVFLRSMPSTPNGKIDRKVLPSLGASAREGHSGPMVQAEIESLLEGLWQEVLGTGSVAPDGNYFDMGATSLDIADVCMKLSNSLGREVQIMDFFTYPTVRALSAHLRVDGTGAPIQPGSERGQSRRKALAGLRNRQLESQ